MDFWAAVTFHEEQSDVVAITKSFRNGNGHFIESMHDIMENGTRLDTIKQVTPKGVIIQRYPKDYEVGGLVFSKDMEIAWGFHGTLSFC